MNLAFRMNQSSSQLLAKTLAFLGFWMMQLSFAEAQDFFERYEDWPEQTTIGRTLVIAPSQASIEQNAEPLRELAAATSIDTSEVLLIVNDEGQSFMTTPLVPDCLLQVVATEPNATTDPETQWLEQLRQHPSHVGIQLSSDSLLILSGRLLQVVGPGYARLSLGETADIGPQTQVLRSPQQRRPVASWLADLTQWRRRAMECRLDTFPPLERQIPAVESGTLLIVGGGGIPDGLMERFIELAGGVDEARLVFVPCSEAEQVPDDGLLRQWRRVGIKHATQLHTKDRNRANSDEEFLAPLRTATGIWFGGGRQWNFADSYYGTEAHRLMKQVLQRGGVIGGSSAGASIQASYLARATPIGNTEIMAPGYERGGLGFITGVAIDQHFSQRNRHADLKSLVRQYPQLLGIGIDETTAIEVRGSRATVIGNGRVFFDQWVQANEAPGPQAPNSDARVEGEVRTEGEVQVDALSAGEVYDLEHRKVATVSTNASNRKAEGR